MSHLQLHSCSNGCWTQASYILLKNSSSLTSTHALTISTTSVHPL